MDHPDSQYLKNEQYKDASKLSARARLHSQYNRNPYSWFKWMFDLYQIPPTGRVLELGAGAGWLWLNNAERIPPGWDITLSDFSPGMLDEQRQSLANVPHPFKHEEIDIQAIPHGDGTFDAVIANHMLYHVPDRAQAIAEMRRVLKPGGRLYTATNGEKHLQENRQLLARFGLQPGERREGFAALNGYTLENASEQLRAQFEHVELHRYDDAIVLDNAEPLLESLLSGRIVLSAERTAALRAFLQAEIAKTGTLTLTKDMGVLIAW